MDINFRSVVIFVPRKILAPRKKSRKSTPTKITTHKNNYGNSVCMHANMSNF